jgi:hypothetical protein
VGAPTETHSGEDLLVVRYLAGRTATPHPKAVAEFVVTVIDGVGDVGSTELATFQTSKGDYLISSAEPDTRSSRPVDRGQRGPDSRLNLVVRHEVA